MTSSQRHDQSTEDVISAAQTYTDPRDIYPPPPKISYPLDPDAIATEGTPGAGPLEVPRSSPEWFEPPALKPDNLSADSQTPDDIPSIDEGGDVPKATEAEERAVARHGVEALAYYAPFHFYGPTRWGIYIRDWGLVYLASIIARTRTLTPANNHDLICAYRVLLEHERFHFVAELASTRFELLSGDRNAYQASVHDPNLHPLEEALANARALESITKGGLALPYAYLASVSGTVANWMKQQPAGYSSYDLWLGKNRKKGEGQFVSRILEISHQANPYANVPGPWLVTHEVLQLFKHADYSRIPIRRVHDSRLKWLTSVRLFPKQSGVQLRVYTNDHLPPHVHVRFLSSDKEVRFEWPGLSPLPNEPDVSKAERKTVTEYVRKFNKVIKAKLISIYGQLPGN